MLDAGAFRLLEAHIAAKAYVRPDGARVDAVRDLALSIRRGEFLCLIGPSGCGKTTTLRILTGLDTAFEGTLSPDPSTLAIGFAFQEPRLLPWRTVEENVRLALPKARRREDLGPLLASVGLQGRAGSYPGELSLGLARRVSLARALAVSPQLLVLDEPFVSLDERAAADLRDHVSAAAQHRGASVLMVTHNVREALLLADRLLVLAPRPTHVVGEVALSEPREARTPAWIEEQRAALARRFPALLEG